MIDDQTRTVQDRPVSSEKMRILFLTNFYPPASRGGYEEWCREVAEGLRNLGHEVRVITSRYKVDEIDRKIEAGVFRELHLEMTLASFRNSISFFTERAAHERENLVCLRDHLASFRPDRVLIWGMWNLTRSLAAAVEDLLPEQVVYYMGDYWPTLPSQYQYYWQTSPRNFLTALPKLLLKPIALHLLAKESLPRLDLTRVIFPTRFLKNEFERRGIGIRQAEVVYGAVNTAPYIAQKESFELYHGQSLALLYVGRLTEDKGVKTAIEALSLLVNQHNHKKVYLTIVGGGEQEYEAYLYKLVEQEGISSWVTFTGPQPKEALPELYRRADIFLFTSVWPEPFGRVIVEAMASDVVVVGTSVGGAAEILIENETGLTYSPGNAEALAAQIVRLIESPALLHRLAKAGREVALRKFDVQRMTLEIEAYLQAMVPK